MSTVSQGLRDDWDSPTPSLLCVDRSGQASVLTHGLKYVCVFVRLYAILQ